MEKLIYSEISENWRKKKYVEYQQKAKYDFRNSSR